MSDKLSAVIATLAADFLALHPSMKRFNPFTAKAEDAAPSAGDAPKPKRTRKPSPAAAEHSPEPASTAAPTALPNALSQAAERVPLATYAALVIETDLDAISTREAFIAFCKQISEPIRDWRMAWKEFEAAGFPGACEQPSPVIADPAPVPAGPRTNVIAFPSPPAACPIEAALAELL